MNLAASGALGDRPQVDPVARGPGVTTLSRPGCGRCQPKGGVQESKFRNFIENSGNNHCNSEYLALACIKTWTSGSKSFQSVRKSL